MKNLFSTVILFFFVYSPTLKYIGPSGIIAFILMILLFFKKKGGKFKFGNTDPNILYLTYIYIALFFISFYISIFYGVMQLYYTKMLFLFTCYVFGGGYLYWTLFLEGKRETVFLKFFIGISLVQASIVLSMLFILPVRDFFIGITVGTYLENGSPDRIRGFGFAESTVYSLSVILSLGLMFIVQLLSLVKLTKAKLILLTFAYFIILFAMLSAGRTGFLGCALSLLIGLYNLKNKNTFNFFIFFTLILTGISIALFFLYMSNPKIKYLLDFSLEIFFNLFQGKGLSSDSSTEVSNMYFMPPESIVLFGSGTWLDPNGNGYFMHVDAGYMRDILYWGFAPSFVFYCSFAFICLLQFKNRVARLFFPLLTLYFLIVHWKGAFLIGSNMNLKVFFILFFVLYLAKTKLKQKE